MRCAAILALVLTLAACSKAPATGSGHAAHPWTVPHVLRVADVSEPDHLNPYLSEMDISYDIASLVYSYLVVSDDRGRLIGDLAATVPTLTNGGISADGRTYIYHLRRGVKWQDGAPFGAADVIASWRAVMNPRNDTFEREGYNVVQSIAARGRYTVVVRLRKRYPPFVSRFFAPLQEGGKPVLPAHVLRRERDFNHGTLARQPIGTGPFRLVEWVRGDRMTFRRFDGYFRGRPRLRRIVLRFIPQQETIAAELRAHHLDLIVHPQTALLGVYREDADAIVTSAAWNAQTSLILNAGNPILASREVRRALAASVPYARILRDVAFGVGRPARSSLPPTALGYVALPARRLDRAAARRRLDRAGWHLGADGIRTRGGRRLTLTLATIAGESNFARIALLLQASLRAVGIDLTIKTYPYRTIFAPDGPIYGGRFDLALYDDTLDWDPDVSNYLACDRVYPRGQNIFRFCDPKLDRLERAGLGSDDPSVRAPIYAAASRRIWHDVPYVALYDARRLIVRSSDLRGYRPNATATPWWNAWQWDI